MVAYIFSAVQFLQRIYLILKEWHKILGHCNMRVVIKNKRITRKQILICDISQCGIYIEKQINTVQKKKVSSQVS